MPTLTRLLVHAYSYTPALTRLLLHGYSYPPTLARLARLLLHASYTPTLARLLHAYSYTPAAPVMGKVKKKEMSRHFKSLLQV